MCRRNPRTRSVQAQVRKAQAPRPALQDPPWGTQAACRQASTRSCLLFHLHLSLRQGQAIVPPRAPATRPSSRPDTRSQRQPRARGEARAPTERGAQEGQGYRCRPRRATAGEKARKGARGEGRQVESGGREGARAEAGERAEGRGARAWREEGEAEEEGEEREGVDEDEYEEVGCGMILWALGLLADAFDDISVSLCRARDLKDYVR